jgi:hypothetical protein
VPGDYVRRLGDGDFERGKRLLGQVINTSAGGLCRWRRGGRWQRSVERPCIQQLR